MNLLSRLPLSFFSSQSASRPYPEPSNATASSHPIPAAPDPATSQTITSSTFAASSSPPTHPPNISSTDTAGSEAVTSDYFNSPAWTSFWTIENNTGPFNWTDGGTIPQVASLGNVFISPNATSPSSSNNTTSNSTNLTLRTLRQPSFQSVAEISSSLSTITHASVRARLRFVPSNNSYMQQSSVQTGAVFGMFTYASDTQESDLEILTSEDSRTLYATNQPDVDPEGNSIDGASTAVGLPDGAQWTRWEDYRLDWLGGDEGSRWWVGGEVLLNKTVNVPKKASQVVLNLWSDGGTWSGKMPVGTEVRVGIEWIEVVYNVSSDGGKGGKCHLGCWVDGEEVKEKGTPVLAFDSTAEGRAKRVVIGGLLLWGLVGAVVLFLL